MNFPKTQNKFSKNTKSIFQKHKINFPKTQNQVSKNTKSSFQKHKINFPKTQNQFSKNTKSFFQEHKPNFPKTHTQLSKNTKSIFHRDIEAGRWPVCVGLATQDPAHINCARTFGPPAPTQKPGAHELRCRGPGFTPSIKQF